MFIKLNGRIQQEHLIGLWSHVYVKVRCDEGHNKITCRIYHNNKLNQTSH